MMQKNSACFKPTRVRGVLGFKSTMNSLQPAKQPESIEEYLQIDSRAIDALAEERLDRSYRE